MTSTGKKIICGGTSANMVAGVLNCEIQTTTQYDDPSIPPIGQMSGIDLVTEGVITLNKTVEILKEYFASDADSTYFSALDDLNGAAQIAKILLESCTDLNVFIGRAINPAHKNSGFPVDLSIKIKLIEEICGLIERQGKKVQKFYY